MIQIKEVPRLSSRYRSSKLKQLDIVLLNWNSWLVLLVRLWKNGAITICASPTFRRVITFNSLSTSVYHAPTVALCLPLSEQRALFVAATWFNCNTIIDIKYQHEFYGIEYGYSYNILVSLEQRHDNPEMERERIEINEDLWLSAYFVSIRRFASSFMQIKWGR